MSRFRRWFLAAAAAGVLGAFGPVFGTAQPPPSPSAERVPPNAGDVLRKLATRYRAGPTCERVNVEVRPEQGVGRVGRSAFVIRLDPRVSKEVADPAVLLELGQLRVGAGAGRFSAVHVHNTSTCYSAPVAGPLTTAALRAVMPPLPLPQLDLANWIAEGDEPGPRELATYARNISWTTCEADPRRPDRVTVLGTCERGSIALTLRGDALQAVEIKLAEPATDIKLTIASLLPCRAEDIKIDTAGRTEVKALSELSPQSGLLGAGATVPEMPITAASGQLQKIKDLYAPPVEFQPNVNAERLVLVFIRDKQATGDAGDRAVGRVRITELATELKKLRRQSYSVDNQPDPTEKSKEPALVLSPVNFAEVLVWDQPPPAEALLGALKREQPAWGDRIFWTTEPKATADLFSTSKDSVAVILDTALRLVVAVPIQQGTTIEQLLDQLTVSLLESADDRGH